MTKAFLISLLFFSNSVLAKEYCCEYITSDIHEGIALAKEHKRDLFVLVCMDHDSATYNLPIKEALGMKRRKYKTSLRSLNAEFVVVKTFQSQLKKFINSLDHKFKDTVLKAYEENKNQNYIFISATQFFELYYPIPLWNTRMIQDLIYVKFGP